MFSLWYLWVLLLTAVAVFIWEHVSRLNGWTFKPSIALEWVVGFVEQTWRWLGSVFAHWSGIFDIIYQHIVQHAAEIIQTLNVFVSLTWRTIKAPCFFVYGYVASMATYVNQHVVVCGSVILGISCVVIANYYFNFVHYFAQLSGLTYMVICFVLMMTIYLSDLYLNPQPQPQPQPHRRRRN